jgi:2-keto-4-pentenoate hydratase
MSKWKKRGIIILLVLLVVYSCSHQQPSSTKDSSGIPESDIRASLLRFSKQFLDVNPADAFLYKMTIEEAYKWQDEFIKLLQPTLGKVIGYKAGGFDRSGKGGGPPIKMRGTFLEKMILKSGAHISSHSYVSSFIESDLLLRVGDEEINTAITDEKILSALDAVIPFIEFPDMMINTKGIPEEMVTTTMIIANMVTRIGVMGTPIPINASKDCMDRLNTFRIVMTDQDGIELGSGSVEEKYEPLEVVRWLRDSLRENGKFLKKGYLLSLGNLGVVVPLDKGATDVTGDAGTFTGSSVKLTYFGLDPAGPAEVVVNFDHK